MKIFEVPAEPRGVKDVILDILMDAGIDYHSDVGMAVDEVVKNVHHGSNGVVIRWMNNGFLHILTMNLLTDPINDVNNGFGLTLIINVIESNSESEFTLNFTSGLALAYLKVPAPMVKFADEPPKMLVQLSESSPPVAVPPCVPIFQGA